MVEFVINEEVKKPPLQTFSFEIRVPWRVEQGKQILDIRGAMLTEVEPSSHSEEGVVEDFLR